MIKDSFDYVSPLGPKYADVSWVEGGVGVGGGWKRRRRRSKRKNEKRGLVVGEEREGR